MTEQTQCAPGAFTSRSRGGDPLLAVVPQRGGQFLGNGLAWLGDLALVEVLAGIAVDLRRSRAVQRGPRALLYGEHSAGQDLPSRPWHPAPDLRRDHAGMQAVRGHVRAGQAPAEFGRVQYVAELGHR